MTVEATGQVLGRRDVRPMLTEDPTKPIPERAFAGALGAFENEGGLCPFGRVLKSPRGPADDIVGSRRVAARENFLDMAPHERPIAGLWLDTPAAPEVQPAVNFLPLA